MTPLLRRCSSRFLVTLRSLFGGPSEVKARLLWVCAVEYVVHVFEAELLGLDYKVVDDGDSYNVPRAEDEVCCVGQPALCIVSTEESEGGKRGRRKIDDEGENGRGGDRRA
jgi:hypothetical protein